MISAVTTHTTTTNPRQPLSLSLSHKQDTLPGTSMKSTPPMPNDVDHDDNPGSATAVFSIASPQPTSTSSTPALVPATPTSVVVVPSPVYIQIRDFGFTSTDERHLGLGTDTPKANRVRRLNRKLAGPDRARARARAAAATIRFDPSSSSSGVERQGLRMGSIGSTGSVDSSDVDVEEEGEDKHWGIGISGWSNNRISANQGGKGWGRFSWTIGSNILNGDGASSSKIDNDLNRRVSSNGTFPSRKDLDMNFLDSSTSSSSSSNDDERCGPRRRVLDQEFTEEFPADDDEGEDGFDQNGLGKRVEGKDAGVDVEQEQEEEPLYPGLYRALYAFKPEGTAEMKLDEDQIIRVVGRGGGVGWAVVIDDNECVSSSSGIGDVGVQRGTKLALVPEGYLEVVKLDWEDEQEGLETVTAPLSHDL